MYQMECTQHLSAATDLDNYKSDPRLIPVDWTPHKGYVNQSIKGISIPRPATGNRSICFQFSLE